MVRDIRACEQMLIGDGKRPHAGEADFREKFRRRLVANVDIAKGAKLTAELVGLKRPLEPKGLPPEYYRDILGKRTARALRQHEPIDWDAVTEA